MDTGSLTGQALELKFISNLHPIFDFYLDRLASKLFSETKNSEKWLKLRSTDEKNWPQLDKKKLGQFFENVDPQFSDWVNKNQPTQLLSSFQWMLKNNKSKNNLFQRRL